MRQICEFLKDMKRKRIRTQKYFACLWFRLKGTSRDDCVLSQKTASEVFNAFFFIIYLIKFAYILKIFKHHTGIENTEKANGKFAGF